MAAAEDAYAAGGAAHDFDVNLVASAATLYQSHAAGSTDATRADQRRAAYTRLLGTARGCDIVTIGESTHGTDEFYRLRTELTQQLLQDPGPRRQHVVLIEASWPECFRVNQYVGTEGSFDASACEAAADFTQFPRWMWRNGPVLEFVEWLRDHNRARKAASAVTPGGDPGGGGGDVAFLGLDLYSLYQSQHALLSFLDIFDPELHSVVTERYRCFAGFGDDPSLYGQAAAKRGDQEVQQVQDMLTTTLAEVQARAGEYGLMGASPAQQLDAIQNAECVVSAEEYYRKNYTGDQVGWNTRDQHMTATVLRLWEHFKQLDGTGTPPRIVIWAHNSHLGDCRATESGSRGEWNVGQMLRQTFSPARVFSIGAGSYTGTVTAAEGWGQPTRRFDLSPGLPGSVDELLHRVGLAHAAAAGSGTAPGSKASAESSAESSSGGQPADLVLVFRSSTSGDGGAMHAPERPADDSAAAAAALLGPFLERMVGVSYIKASERESHHVQCSLSHQFDAWIHIDTTTAVVPIDGWDGPP